MSDVPFEHAAVLTPHLIPPGWLKMWLRSSNLSHSGWWRLRNKTKKVALSTLSVRTYRTVRGRLSRARCCRKSGPMPKVKEALPLVKAGAADAPYAVVVCSTVDVLSPCSPLKKKKSVVKEKCCVRFSPLTQFDWSVLVFSRETLECEHFCLFIRSI